MAATTVATSRTIASGNVSFDAIDQSGSDFLTIVAKYSNVNQEVKIKVKQTIDDTEYADIAFPGSKEMYFPILGTGTRALNLVGLHCSKIQISLVVGTATAGTIDSLKVWNS